MASLQISLSDEFTRFVERRTAELGLASASDYLIWLLDRAYRKHEAVAQLEADIREGLESGPGVEVTEEYIEQKLARLKRRHRQDGDRPIGPE